MISEQYYKIIYEPECKYLGDEIIPFLIQIAVHVSTSMPNSKPIT